MFSGCSSLTEIYLGKTDFALSKNFKSMFYGCSNLEKLDVSNLNTENCYSFYGMFHGCSKLKEINVSNFKTYNCRSISNMFEECKSLISIDMLNWDMRNIGISTMGDLFCNCSSLKNIKINCNLSRNPFLFGQPLINNMCFKVLIYFYDNLKVYEKDKVHGIFYG